MLLAADPVVWTVVPVVWTAGLVVWTVCAHPDSDMLCVLSECIKIQPTDIQPDVFSYLLHIMYTGLCPKQPVDQSRLQEGIKFLHAYQLSRKPSEGTTDGAVDVFRMSNLYGIQISSQLANKDIPRVLKSAEASRGGTSVSRSSGRRGRSLAIGLDGVPSDKQTSTLHKVCSVASGDDSDVTTRIKQERLEEEEVEDGEVEEEQEGGSPAHASSPSHDLFKDRPMALLCPRCGQRCSSPEGLREHLFSHALDPTHLVEGLSQGGEPDTGPEEVDTGCLEEALRQSQALANQLAAELRRSRGGGEGCSPAATISSRKRKIACAVCSLRFAHKSQLQEHMYTHTGKPSRLHRYNRLCSQLFQASANFCEASAETAGGGGASVSTTALTEEATKDTQDNGSSCYSLDSEVSQESIEGGPAE